MARDIVTRPVGTGTFTSAAPGHPVPHTGSSPVTNSDPGADSSAKLQLEQDLTNVGLGAWADFAWNEHLKGVPAAQILIDIRGTDLYKQKFPGMDELRKQGLGWNEATYIAYEKQAKDTLHLYGIPAGMFDSPQDLSKLMIGGVSPVEFDNRVKEAAAVTLDYSPEAKAELQRMYGVGPGGVVAFALDPVKAEPLLKQQFAAARLAGAADSTGYGQIGQSDAEILARQGVTDQQAQAGFSRLASESQLFGGLPGTGEADIGQQTQLGAEFSNSTPDQQQILDRQRARVATFAGGGQVATSGTGVVGLSKAQT